MIISKFINKCFYHYIYNDESITTVHNENNHRMVIDCFKKIKSEIDNSNEELMNWFYCLKDFFELVYYIAFIILTYLIVKYAIKTYAFQTEKSFKLYCK